MALSSYRISSISCGYLHVVAIAIPNSSVTTTTSKTTKTQLNEIFSWGLGENGQLGHGTRDNKLIPTKINLSSLIKPNNNNDNNNNDILNVHCVDLIACGHRHTCVSFRVSLEGSKNVREVIASWGEGKDGRLGLGHTRQESFPKCLLFSE